MLPLHLLNEELVANCQDNCWTFDILREQTVDILVTVLELSETFNFGTKQCRYTSCVIEPFYAFVDRCHLTDFIGSIYQSCINQ